MISACELQAALPILGCDDARFERNLIRERTVAGLKAARGRTGGRPSKLSTKEIKTIRALLKSADIPVSEIAARFHIARSTLYRTLKPAAG
jgi:DNA invertase Pin-like site-specific DNA recombinase